MNDHTPTNGTGTPRGLLELLREEAILAELDPDRLGRELPSDMPESARAEWEDFVALCDRLDAHQSSSSPQPEESDRSAGCL